jgi:hypothetical protein
MPEVTYMRASAASYWLLPLREGMAILKIREWGRKDIAHPALGVGLCLALITLVVYRLEVASAQRRGSFGTDDLRDGVAVFDSFSEPSVACAILTEETDRLLQVYCSQRGEPPPTQTTPAGTAEELAARPGAGQETDLATASRTRSGPPMPLIQPLTALDAQVQAVNLRVGRTLLAIYFEQHLWNQFVDRYLQMVWEGPGRPEVMTWARSALYCSQKCGRAEEVEAVLHHVIRFHPELKTIEGLKDVLADLKTDLSSGLEVGKR